jgi:hypothetical protein
MGVVAKNGQRLFATRNIVHNRWLHTGRQLDSMRVQMWCSFIEAVINVDKHTTALSNGDRVAFPMDLLQLHLLLLQVACGCGSGDSDGSGDKSVHL